MSRQKPPEVTTKALGFGHVQSGPKYSLHHRHMSLRLRTAMSSRLESEPVSTMASRALHQCAPHVTSVALCDVILLYCSGSSPHKLQTLLSNSP